MEANPYSINVPPQDRSLSGAVISRTECEMQGHLLWPRHLQVCARVRHLLDEAVMETLPSERAMTPTLRMVAIDTLKVDTNVPTTDAVPNEPGPRLLQAITW